MSMWTGKAGHECGNSKILLWIILSSHLMQTLSISSLAHLKELILRVPIVAQWLTIPTRNHEVVGSVPAPTQWVNDLALP